MSFKPVGYDDFSTKIGRGLAAIRSKLPGAATVAKVREAASRQFDQEMRDCGWDKVPEFKDQTTVRAEAANAQAEAANAKALQATKNQVDTLWVPVVRDFHEHYTADETSFEMHHPEHAQLSSILEPLAAQVQRIKSEKDLSKIEESLTAYRELLLAATQQLDKIQDPSLKDDVDVSLQGQLFRLDEITAPPVKHEMLIH